MSVYVDAITVYPVEMMDAHTRRNGVRWSHMWCDAGEDVELHRIAAVIGLKPAWYQTHGSLHHYDVTPPKRALAIKAGAVERSLRDWMRERRDKRAVGEIVRQIFNEQAAQPPRVDNGSLFTQDVLDAAARLKDTP